MKGADVIQIATAVFGIKWFDTLETELGITADELSEITKMEKVPGPISYALSDIVTKYMARVESMQLHNNLQDLILKGEIESNEQAAFISGVTKGMQIVLAAVHGEPEELQALSKTKDYSSILAQYLQPEEEQETVN